MDARRLAAIILALSSAAPLVRAASVFEYFNAIIAELVSTFSGWIIGAIYNAMFFVAITSAIFFVLRLHHFMIPIMRSIVTRLVSELPMWLGVIRVVAPLRRFASFVYKHDSNPRTTYQDRGRLRHAYGYADDQNGGENGQGNGNEEQPQT